MHSGKMHRSLQKFLAFVQKHFQVLMKSYMGPVATYIAFWNYTRYNMQSANVLPSSSKTTSEGTGCHQTLCSMPLSLRTQGSEGTYEKKKWKFRD
jgi:hypothetical protein